MELFRSIFQEQQQQTTPKQKFSHPQNQAAKCEIKIKNHSIFYYKITPNQFGVKSHQHGRSQSFSATFVISP